MMKIKAYLLFFSAVAIVTSSSFAGADIVNRRVVFQERLQKIINNYYKNYNKKEKFTSIAATVLIPNEEKSTLNDLNTVVYGTMGYPPFSQSITSTDLFDIGSITKSFTALILLQLQSEGKLSLDDPLGKWLPQYPEWKKVTLRRLLNMTSGIPNYSADPEFEIEMIDLKRIWTDEELLAYAHPEKPIEYNENNPFYYSNSNYILAGLVIEKVTQDTFEHQLQERIIHHTPYLRNSFYPAGPSGVEVQQAIKDRKIHGYLYDEETTKLYDTFTNDLSWAGAAGAIVATTEDVAQWVQILYHGTLINPEYRAKALEELESVVSMKTGLPIPTVTADDPSAFGLGVGYHYDVESNQRYWTYQGSTLGFRVMYLWTECNNVTAVVAVNGKGGEGNDNARMGNHINEVNLELYQAALEQYPELRCNHKTG